MLSREDSEKTPRVWACFWRVRTQKTEARKVAVGGEAGQFSLGCADCRYLKNI